MKKLFLLLILCFLSTQWNSLSAQVASADTNLYRVVKSNKQEYKVNILSENGGEVLSETLGSKIVNRYSFPVPMCTWFYKF